MEVPGPVRGQREEMGKGLGAVAGYFTKACMFGKQEILFLISKLN